MKPEKRKKKSLFLLPYNSQGWEKHKNRIIWIRRNLWRITEPNLLLKQVSYRKMSRQILNISREGISTTSLGSLLQCSATLTVTFFLVFVWIFLLSLVQNEQSQVSQLEISVICFSTPLGTNKNSICVKKINIDVQIEYKNVPRPASNKS